MAAFEGLVRFDGHSFHLFAPGNTPGIETTGFRSVFLARDKALIAVSNSGGLVLRQGQNWRTLKKADGLPSEVIWYASEDTDGTIWMATRDGVVRWDRQTFALFGQESGFPPGDIRFIRRLADGVLYVGTSAGLYQANGPTFARVPGTEVLATGNVWRAHVDAHGRLWSSLGRDGLWRFVPGQAPKQFSTNTGLPTNEFYDLGEWRGSVWSTTDRGLVRFAADDSFEVLGTNEGLGADNLGGLFEDAEGALWVGAWRGGLSRLRRGKFINYTVREGLPNGAVFAIDQDAAGRIWISTYSGLYRLDRDYAQPIAIQGLPSGMVRDTEFTAEGTFVAIINRGVFQVEGEQVVRRWQTPADGLPDNRVRNLWHNPRDGSLWIGSTAGLFIYQDGKIRTEDFGLSVLRTSILYINSTPDGAIWVAFDGAGLLRLRDGQSTLWNKAKGLPADVVFHVQQVGEDVWVATQAGLVAIRDERIHVLSAKDGLPGDGVYFVIDDPAGQLWIGGVADGLLRLRPEDTWAYWQGVRPRVPVVTYGLADGMAAPEITVPSRVLRDRHNRLWFPTLRGVSSIAPLHYSTNERSPPIILESMAMNDEAPGPLQSTIPPGVRRLDFRFIALSLTAPERNRYEVKLDGFDQDWVDNRGRREASYTNLAPGRYTFRVRATNNDGVVSQQEAAFLFEVRPHFWQTWWFYSGCVLGLLVLAYSGFRWRVESLRQRGLELQQQVDERTRDLHEKALLLELASNEVRDSLQYAARLQQAVVLTKAEVSPGSLAIERLFLPRSIVSGDFYWVVQRPPYTFVAVDDCTGHGVPGAFLSILADMLLRRVVHEHRLHDPGEILDRLVTELTSLLPPGVDNALAMAGMDAALCVITDGHPEICFAGARRPLWIFTPEGLPIEVRGSRRSIEAGTRTAERRFATHRLLPPAGSTLVLFTDGLADQQNPDGKKLGLNAFRLGLAQACAGAPPLSRIRDDIAQLLREHQGEAPPVDDITVLFIRWPGAKPSPQP